jgi:hypothetical protein
LPKAGSSFAAFSSFSMYVAALARPLVPRPRPSIASEESVRMCFSMGAVARRRERRTIFTLSS